MHISASRMVVWYMASPLLQIEKCYTELFVGMEKSLYYLYREACFHAKTFLVKSKQQAFLHHVRHVLAFL